MLTDDFLGATRERLENPLPESYIKENCHILQLTTNSERTNAHHFYETLGFAGIHLGMKLYLK